MEFAPLIFLTAGSVPDFPGTGVAVQVIGHHEDTDHESEDEPVPEFLT